MFTKSAQFYDALYAWKDYRAEAEQLRALIDAHKRSAGNALLDVACGTGKHLELLREHYAVEGLDLDDELLDIARQRLPDVPLHQGDMRDFDLGRSYDAITCLFSSIGYVRSVEGLNQAVGAMARHLLPGGVLIVEPWLSREIYQPGSVHGLYVNEPELKIARITTSQIDSDVSVMDFHYLVGTPEGVQHFVEHHELAMFTQDQYLDAFRAAGLDVTADEVGLTGRGLYIGVKPA